MTEAFLQYVWQHKLLEGPLTTVDGLAVSVERAGELNRNAGPDFFDARIVVDGVLWAGNVEVHIKASDWNAHKHSNDRAYNNVILHVVYIHDADIVLENGKHVATIDISQAVPDYVWENYEKLMNPADDSKIACAKRLPEIPDFLFNISQERLLIERIERKSGNVERLLNESKGNWEETAYWLVAHYFGGKVNAFPFELLAKVTPMRIVAKIKDNPFRVEALYFGQSGLLEAEVQDEYSQRLKREYNYLSAAYGLRPEAGHLWKFFRVRPSSFPTLRISQFANLMTRSENIFSKLLEADDVQTLRGLFRVRASDYWQTHFDFDKPSENVPVNLGKNLADNIIINAWIPLLFQYGVTHGSERSKNKALELLHQLPPENNRIVRLWRDAGKEMRNAAESQSAIQRYTEYCSRKQCLECPLAFRLLKTKTEQR